ncbi:hypothetical protein ALQ78_05776 [Pseudomonas syringae pv. aptata]|nr:hypothetical protein ALQ78_05776 [Pseudomonas syringae pv. aptata]
MRCCGLARLAGKQFLPVQLPVGFTCGPGFQLLAADLAYGNQLLCEVDRCFADVQALQAYQRATVGSVERERRDTGRDVGQLELGLLGQVQCVGRAEIQHAVLKRQRQGITYVRPPQFHLAVGDLQRALGGDRDQADAADPVDLPTVRTRRDQGHVGIVFRQCAEVLELEIQRVVEKLDGLAGAQVLEVNVASRQFDFVDTQREWLAGGFVLCRFAGGQLEQLCQIELALFVEQQLGAWFDQLDALQMQGPRPQAVDLQIGIKLFKRHLLLAWRADVQAPERQLQREGVEFQAFELCRHCGVIGQLLVRDPQSDAGKNEKTQQTVERDHSQQGAKCAFQSSGHGQRRLSLLEALGVWHACSVPKALPSRLVGTFRLYVKLSSAGSELQNQRFQRRLIVLRREVCSGTHLLAVAHRTPGLGGTAQYLFTPVLHADFRQIVAADQHAIVCRGQQRRFEQALIVAQQVNGAERALGPGGWIKQDQIILALLQFHVAGQLLAAACGNGQPGQLTDCRKIIRLDELHRRQLRIERAILATHRQIAFGEVQIAHFTRATGRSTEADAAGVGEQIQHAFPGAVPLDPAAGVAQVEKQQRVLACMPAADPVIEPPFVADMIGQSRFFSLVHGVMAIHARVALRAIVIDQQGIQAQTRVGLFMQRQQGIAIQAGMKALHQQLRAVAVDGQPAGALLAAVKQSIAVRPLPMQLVKQRLAIIEGDAERLIQGRHAERLGLE